MKVLFVCTGNTCRSPFAEGVARRLAGERGLEVELASAGTRVVGTAVTGDAVVAARERHVDLRAFSPRQLTAELVADADAVVAMEAEHLPDGAPGAAHVLGVTDPFGRGIDAYRRAYQDIEDAVARLLDELAVEAR